MSTGSYSWARMDLGLVDHPKVLQLTSAHAVALYTQAILYSARQLTDGFIPTPAVQLLLPPGVPRQPIKAAVRQLVKVGLWEDAEGGYRIHDYLEYQPSRDEVRAKVAEAKATGSEGGRKSGEARRRKKAEREAREREAQGG